MQNDSFTAADRRFFEPIESRPIDRKDFVEGVARKLGTGWKLVQRGVWLNCLNEKHELPLQGWKIHLSTVPGEARRLLEVVSEHLIERGVSFKFLADAGMLRLTSGKGWSRGATGKFITIFPRDLEQFKTLLAALFPLTREFRGPYILSDRRYKDSKVLYYRYGGIRPNSRLQIDGSRLPVLVDAAGREHADRRDPFYSVPPWAEEPFPAPADDAPAELLNGRYAVEKVLHFSSVGGIYVALDSRSDKRVILKEARAHVHVGGLVESTEILDREYETLKQLEGCGFAPRPIELFTEWEHSFLAQEYFEGYLPLRTHAGMNGIYLDTRPTPEKVRAELMRDLTIVRKLAGVVDEIHARGIVWGDLSLNNVLVHPETGEVKVIDMEGASRLGEKKAHRVYTAGFAAPGSADGAQPEDDYFGIGAILLYLLTHVNGVLELKPQAWREMLAEMTKDFGLPRELTLVVEKLLDPAPERRPKPSALLDEAWPRLEALGEVTLGAPGADVGLSTGELSSLISGSARFIEASADPRRKDRLFPADPQVYQTNPLSLAHGAAGVLYALSKVEGQAPERLMSWLLKAEPLPDSYPPGLYIGLSGVAWSLLELGRRSQAEAIMEKAAEHPLLGASSDLYHGLAGWGMTCLRFWLSTGKEVHLERARAAGRRLIETAQEANGCLRWPGADGVVPYGFYHGSSGIALFLLYLDRAVGGGFEDSAVRALEHDLALAVEKDGGLAWKRDSEHPKVVYPYLKMGSAGVGVALLRFLKALPCESYQRLLDGIYLGCDAKYTVFPGRSEGLAGIGEFMLDAYALTREVKFLEGARRAASGLRLFAIREDEGTAFPGNGLSRISCDLATGSAGIMLFLHRLRTGAGPDFLVDEVLS